MLDTPQTPENEDLRILALERYKILDSLEEGAFDRITRLASSLLKTPLVLVSLVGKDQVWFKAQHGLNIKQIDRELGLCASAILGNSTYIIENTKLDPRSRANSLVTGELGIQFYAGAPLTTHDNFNLGALCCLDFQPRTFSPQEIDILETLAALVMEQMELRMSARFIEYLRQELEHSNAELARQKNLLEYELEMARTVYTKVTDYNVSHLTGLDYKVQPKETVGGDFFLPFMDAANQNFYLMIGDLTGHGLQAALSVLLIADSFAEVCQSIPSVEKIAYEINAKMCKLLPKGMFCASMILKINQTAATFDVWHGGLPEAYLLNSNGKIINILTSKSFALGVFAEQNFENSALRFNLAKYASLLIFSDGVNEQLNRDGVDFGYENIKQALQETPADKRRIDYVLQKLNTHQQATPQTDDLAIFELHFDQVIETLRAQKTA